MKKEEQYMKERKGLIRWNKEHKKELIIAGISSGTLVLIILGIKNQDTIKAVWTSLQKAVKHSKVNVTEAVTKVTVGIPQETINEVVTAMASNSNSIPFEVSRHIRNLPYGWHASPEKAAEALKNNIILMDGQTWVDSYMKGGVAA